jgi:hypothetical protein
MSPNHSDTCAPHSDLEPQNWILTAEMGGSPQGITHPRSRNLVLRRRWHKVRWLRAARRAGGFLAFPAHPSSLVDHVLTTLLRHFSFPSVSVIASEVGVLQ